MMEKSFKQRAQDVRWQPTGVQSAVALRAPSLPSPVRICLWSSPTLSFSLPVHTGTEKDEKGSPSSKWLTYVHPEFALWPESTNEHPAKVKMHLAATGKWCKAKLAYEKKNNNNKGEIY